MSQIAPPRTQNDANQTKLEHQTFEQQAALSADAARTYQEISAPAVIDDNSAQHEGRDYYNNDNADDDSDLIEIVRYRQEHPAQRFGGSTERGQNRSDAKSYWAQELMKNGLNKGKVFKIRLDNELANC